MNRRLTAFLVVLLGAARPAGAVCTAADVMRCGANCWTCAGNTCTIAKNLTVTPPRAGVTCTFDFGVRDIHLVSGGFTGDSNTFEIRAHSLVDGATGVLRARGGSTAPGGTIILTLGTGGLTVLSTANPIDVGGANLADLGGPTTAGAGNVIVQSDGNVTLGGNIAADGSTTHASGGTITITAGRWVSGVLAASGTIAVRAPISAAAGAAATGGSVTLTAIGGTGSGRVDVENLITVTGGASGGSISVDASGDAILGVNPNGGALLNADGNGDASDGGSISVLAGGKVMGSGGQTSRITARGSSAVLPANGGGGGGDVTIEAQGGPITLGGVTMPGIFVDGGQLACGGMICLQTDQPGTSISLAVPISATAPGNGGLGGCVQLCSNGDATITAPIDASSGGCGGAVCIDALQAITLSAAAQNVLADGGLSGSGGSVDFCANGPIALNGPSISASSPSADGGCVGAMSDATIASSGPISATAAATGGGGDIDLEAGGNLTVAAAGPLDARGGATGGAGGTTELIAGSDGFPGTLSMSAAAHLNGTANAGLPTGATLGGCTVHLAATASIDSAGDRTARNQLTARTAFAIDPGAHVITTGIDPNSRNVVILPVRAALPSSGAFTPPLAPGDIHALPVCTGPDTPPGCLDACPVCGNGVVEFPETCEPMSGDLCCTAVCRATECSDGDPCTVDTCDPSTGCVHTPVSGCGPTTTTSATTTTTTTISAPPSTTSTTLTVASTTTTTGATTTTTTFTASPSTTTTLAPACIPGTPLACDDGDPCTRDACVDGRCTHTPVVSFDAVLCRLDNVRQLLQSSVPTVLGGSAQATRLEATIQHARTLTVAAEGVTGRKRLRRLAKVGKQLAVFMHLVQRGERRRTLQGNLASRLLTLVGTAVSDLQPLRAAR